jgi:hypothetical protein
VFINRVVCGCDLYVVCVVYVWATLDVCRVPRGEGYLCGRVCWEGAVQPTVPECRLAGVAMMGPVRLPSIRGDTVVSMMLRKYIFLLCCIGLELDVLCTQVRHIG